MTTSAAHLSPPSVAKLDPNWLKRCWPLRSYLELGALETAPASARAHVGAVLHEWELSSLADDACLITSELITNAIVATRAERRTDPVRLWMLGCTAGVLLLIWDSTMPAPVLGVATADAEHGRGLHIVDAVSNRWGSYQADGHHGGKVVWALLESGRAVRRVSVFPLVNGTRARNRTPVDPQVLARVKAALERLPPVPAAHRGSTGDAR